MDSLMILHLDYMEINGTYENFPEDLRWLRMCGCPLKSIPSELPMENLVALDMSYCNIEFFDMSCSSHQRTQKRQKLLGSLKILNLSFSKQLRGVGGFCELPLLESLFLSNCSSLIEICESIDHCDELVFIDLSNCKDLQNLPRTLAKLKTVKTLLLDGCNKGELAIMEVVPRDFKSCAVYFSSSLVTLSLENNNLSNESFPMDFSSLSMLEYLWLDNNPIVSMPDCVRTLPRLMGLFMQNCAMLRSIEHPPPTLLFLRFLIKDEYMPWIRKVSFDPEMSPIYSWAVLSDLPASSVEIEGIIKCQPIAGVDETILRSLGWSNLEFIYKRHVGTFGRKRGAEESRTQMYYEFGIFSTIYGGKVMPTWIRRRRKGSLILFTIPSSPNKLRGLNICYVQTLIDPFNKFINLPHIKISNITKNLTWYYKHHVDRINVGGKSLIFLSHWMFGQNEMEDGDQLTISMEHAMIHEWVQGDDQRTNDSRIRECGVSFVYDDGKTEKEEDPLSYYKSWNHIIGGDLSSFQLTTQEYILNTSFFQWDVTSFRLDNPHPHPFIEHASFLPASSIEIEGMIKIQPMAGVDGTILCSLGWSNLEFLNKRHVGTYNYARGPEGSQTQMYYEFGIFSTIYGGKLMPAWITCRGKGPSISFTIPSSPNKLRGLNFCYNKSNFVIHHQLIHLPRIKLRNITKNLTWLYKHHLDRVNVGGKSFTFLSHWMFGENDMEDGDQLTISIKHSYDTNYSNIRECGVSFVYDDGKNEKEEDPLSYYKSWNHILGGDLSPFQLTTQKYNLESYLFYWYGSGYHFLS